LEEPPSDFEIECEIVAFSEFSRSKTLTVAQAEFASQNTNYLSVLFHEFDVPETTNSLFKVFCLQSPGMPCETSFNLNDLVAEAHLYGKFNKELEFVSFAQSQGQCKEFMALDFFCVTFLMKNGDIFTLSPLLL